MSYNTLNLVFCTQDIKKDVSGVDLTIEHLLSGIWFSKKRIPETNLVTKLASCSPSTLNHCLTAMYNLVWCFSSFTSLQGPNNILNRKILSVI